ncbi:unnamed protein product [Rhizophagus irregularis]|nr:unnamed protein product [Rhizophagus irregularis]
MKLFTYEIDDRCEDSLPLLLIVGWKISISEKNKWIKYFGFKAHSTTIDGSINDGNNAQLNICIRPWGLLDRLFS